MIYLKIGILVVICLISFMCFKIVYRFLTNLTHMQESISASIDTSLKNKNTYNRAQLKLSQYGIMYRFNDYDLAPSKYLILRVFSGLILGFGLIALSERFNVILLVGGTVIGFFGLDWWFKRKNKSDNASMLKDLFNIYLTLKIQLSSNFYIIDSLESCKDIVNNKRLRYALDELTGNLSSRTKNFNESIDIFRDRFKSDEIMNLYTFLKSYSRFGATEKYLSDIMAEINEISTATTLKEEHDIETKSNVVNFFFFAVILAVIAYGAFTMVGTIEIF